MFRIEPPTDEPDFEDAQPVRSRLEIRLEVFELCRALGVELPEDWVTWPPPPLDERDVPGYQQELPLDR